MLQRYVILQNPPNIWDILQDSGINGNLGLPYAIIFAPDGKIIARDIRGDDIDKKLAEIFGE